MACKFHMIILALTLLVVNTLSITSNGWLPSDEKRHQDVLFKMMEPDFKNMDQEKKNEIMNYYSLANNHFDLIKKENEVSKNTKASGPTIHPKCEWYLQTKYGKRIKISNFCQDCKIEEKSASPQYDEEIPVTFPPFISAYLETLDEQGQENLIKGYYYLYLAMVNWMKAAGHRLSKEELKHAEDLSLFSSPREKKNLADSPVNVDSVGNKAAGRPQLRNQCILLMVLIALFSRIWRIGFSYFE